VKFTINNIPNVLCISGHDPSGGAGIQADIESINSCGAHALSIISCTTIQDSQNVYQVIPLEHKVVEQQIITVLSDSHIAAVKIGLIATQEIIQIIASSVDPLLNTPIVLDPVFSAGGAGKRLSQQDLIDDLRKYLLHKITIITPNTDELKLLTGESQPDIAAKQLLDAGVAYVLLTGTHDESTLNVVNTLYSQNTKQQWNWPRLQGCYHGSGCTLASALAAYLAQGVDATEASFQAQKFTWGSLQAAYQSGKGQLTPNRKILC
jgi:hydroxymethylpyrimidine/phosphomethylpyrimidine kinase